MKQTELDESKQAEYDKLNEYLGHNNYLDGYKGENIVTSNEIKQDMTTINQNIKFLRVLAHVKGNNITYYLLDGNGKIVKK